MPPVTVVLKTILSSCFNPQSIFVVPVAPLVIDTDLTDRLLSKPKEVRGFKLSVPAIASDCVAGTTNSKSLLTSTFKNPGPVTELKRGALVNVCFDTQV